MCQVRQFYSPQFSFATLNLILTLTKRNMKRILIIFICLGLRCIAATRVTFGISVSQQAPSEFLNSNGRSVLAGLQFFVQSANTWNITIVNKTDPLTFAIKALEDYGNSTIVRQNYQTLVNDPEINFLIGPVSTPLSAAAKAVTEPAGRLLLGTKDGSSSFYTGSDFSFSVATSPPRYATTMFPEFRIKGIRKIVLVVEQTPFQIDIAKGFVANANDFSIQVVMQLNVVNDTLFGITDEFVQNITDTAKLIRDVDQTDGAEHTFDAVVIASFTNVGRYMLEAMRKMNYLPKAIFISSFQLGEFQALDPSLTAYVCGCDVIAPGINFRGDYFGTYEEFLAGFDATMPANLGPADANHAVGAVSGVLLMLSIINADSLDNNEVTRALARINEDTFFGPFQFGADNSQLRFLPIIQFAPEAESYSRYVMSAAPDSENSIAVIGPSRVVTGELTYPIPTWDERIFNPKYVSAEYSIMAITAGKFKKLNLIWVSSKLNFINCNEKSERQILELTELSLQLPKHCR
jgi:ABC-type branched-subunit amino acid transport system substrate-binding protein